MKKTTLTRKAAFAISIMLMPLFVSIFYGYTESSDHLKKRFLDDMTAMAEAYEGQVYQFLEMSRRRAEDFSSDGLIRNLLPETLAGSEEAAGELRRHLAGNKLVLDDTIHAIDIISPSGTVIASTRAENVGRDVSREPFFTGGLAAPSYSESGYEGDGSRDLIASAPVKSGSGRTLAVIANHIHLDELDKLLGGELIRDLGALTWDQTTHSTFEVYIVGRDMRRIAGGGIIKAVEARGKDHVAVGTEPVTKCASEESETRGFYRDYRGVDVAGVSMCLPSLGWTLVMEIDSSEVLSPLAIILGSTLTSGLIVLGIAGLLLLLFIRNVTRPLKEMSGAAIAMADGDYGVRLPYESGDEIGGLAEAFNRMASEIKARTEALAESEERHRMFHETAFDALFIADSQGRIVGCNPSAERMFGYAPGELLGRDVSIIIPKDLRERHVRAMKLFLNTGRSTMQGRTVELEGLRKDGEVFPLELIVSSFTIDGKVSFTGTLRDITERKRTEGALLKLTHAVEQSPDIVVITDTDGLVEYVNPKFTEITGYAAAEVLGRPAEELGTQDPGERAAMWEAISSGGEWRGEFLNHRKDGGTYWEDSVISSVKDGEGNITNYVKVASDMTERREFEQALKESEEKYRSIFKSSRDVIFLFAPDGRILDINPAGLELYGYSSADEMATADFFGSPREMERFMSEVEQEGFVKDFEVTGRKKDGAKVVVSISVNAVTNDDGEMTAYRGVARDITINKRLEEQLLQAQKMEAVGQLTGGIAHDFNNILTAIIGYGNIMLYKNPEGDPNRALAENILEAAERAANLTQGLLAFSRKQVVDLRPVKLNSVIESVEKLLTRLIGEDIVFETALSDADPVVMGDAGQIEQVLMNLATNARDAMPGGGDFSISTEMIDLDSTFSKAYGYGEPGRYAVIRVADTGEGMPREVQDKIFDPFYTTKEVGKGTGLGLSMVYGVVTQHTGYVQVYSEPGMGTVFKIYLPLAEGYEESSEKGRSAELARGTETVLLAEDEKFVREMTKSLLEDSGYRVIEAVDGEDALRKFNEHRDAVDIVILDVVMPGRNGKQVYDEIRAVRGEVRSIFTSGYNEDIIHRKGILKDGLDFITKPVRPHELLKKIREVLDR